MANDTLEGKRIVFLIDPANGSSYDLVVCLTNNTYTRAANVIDASSKCGTKKLNGTKDRTIQIEGIVEINSGAGRVSEADLNSYFENDTKIGWAMGPETAVSGEVTYSGTDAVISNLELSAPVDGAATFSATIQLSGVPTQTIES